MAKAKSKATTAKRSDYYRIDPNDIIVREELRGRKFAPTKEMIVAMAMSIFDHEQKQTVLCRKVAGGKFESVAGFTRNAAVRLIRQGFKGTDGKRRHDPERLLKVMLTKANDIEALIANIIENKDRNPTSDIDDAFNQQRLRDAGKSDAEISRIYRYKGQQKVGRLRKLLELTEDEQLLVHRGVLGTQAALDLLEMGDKDRKKIVAKAKKVKKISGSEVADTLRESILRDNEDAIASKSDNSRGATQTKFKARTVRNIRSFFEEMREDYDDPAIAAFSKSMLEFVGGKASNKKMENAIIRLLEAEVTEVEEEYSDVA